MPKPKYDREQLRNMAAEALAAKGNRDPRFSELVDEMVRRTGMSRDSVEMGIFQLAIGL